MINQEIWELLEKLYTKFSELKCKNADDKQICQAEDILKLKFSDFYRYFLKNHSVSSIGNYTIVI